MAMRVPAAMAIRGGLVAIGLLTLGMGVEHRLAGWMTLRSLAGIASAWVLIFVSAWCLEKLSPLRRPVLNSAVFAGVVIGIAAAGWFCLVLMHAKASSAQAWTGLGILSLAVTAVIWPVFGEEEDVSSSERGRPTASGPRWDPEAVRLVLCYGAFGFGYIIPATFLPVMARRAIHDPSIFGWAWPIFGTATALSTLIGAMSPRFFGYRRLWMLSALAMALGVGLPVVWRDITAIMLAALAVGGTFMVNTMAGMQEARQVAGGQATGLIAAMTSAFGFGQVAGPICVSYVVGADGDFSAALLIASLLLLASAGALSWPSGASSADGPTGRPPFGVSNGGIRMSVEERSTMSGVMASTAASELGQERMPPIPTERMTEAQRKAAAELAAGPRGGVRGPFVPLLRSPELMSRLQKVGEYLRYQAVLGPKLIELLILIVAREWTQHFEWCVHHPLALKAGVRPDIAAAIADGRRPSGMAEDEELVYDFCAELVPTHGVSETTYQRAIAKFGEQGVIDMLGVVGYFTTVSMVMNVAHTPPPGNGVAPLAALPG